MIYKFKSQAAGDVIMLAPAGDALMRVLGREPSAKGIIEVADTPQAMAAIQALAEAIASPGGTYRDRRKVQAELAKRRWAWQRYLFDPAQVTHTEPPPEKGAT